MEKMRKETEKGRVIMQLKDVNLSAEKAKELTAKYMIETYERFPFVAVKAKDMLIYDENGEAYLDFYGGVAVNGVGCCNEKVVAAIQDQAADIIHTFNYPHTVPQAVLAELICKSVGMDKIFFQNSGAEANEAMIKMVRKYGVEKFGPERYHIVTATNSFHGRTYGAMSATGQPGSALHIGFEPLVPGFSYAEFNNLEAFKAACTENTIGIMIEPCQGEGGIYPATQEFMTGLRKLCDEKGMFLMLDEIQTGWGRTGALMDYMNYGVKPDIVTMAKAMGGGMPIGAVCATAELASAFNAGSHGSTYAGNPVCCAAAYAACNEIIDRKLSENAKVVGDYFAKKCESLPHVKEVRHAGLLIGVEFDNLSSVEIKHVCIEKKLLVTAIGKNIIRMASPLIATKEDCDKAYDILKEAAEEVAAK